MSIYLRELSLFEKFLFSIVAFFRIFCAQILYLAKIIKSLSRFSDSAVHKLLLYLESTVEQQNEKSKLTADNRKKRQKRRGRIPSVDGISTEEITKRNKNGSWS